MNEAIISSALAPLMKEPSPRAEMVSQMVTGETAVVLEDRHPWLRVRRAFDGYEGWVHRGYLKRVGAEESAAWRARALFLGEAAELEDLAGRRVSLPLLARLAPHNDEWELSSGFRGRKVGGSIHPAEALARSCRATRSLDWVRAHFSGAAYLWGGITPWGVDCSGLVQTAFAARGRVLPRDSHDQAGHGEPVEPGDTAPGDLLFFSENGTRITHVAFAGEDDTLVHSTLACGGFTIESWLPGSRAAMLRDQLVAVRRLPG
jgi:cell wall-associated NlpC family hydrolase